MKRAIPAVVVLAVVTAATAHAPASHAARSTVCNRGLITVERSPARLLPLTANAIGPAVRAALRYTRRSTRPLVTGADLATTDHVRGGEAKFDCGTRVWRRTVVVYIRLRAFLPSASLSQNVFFVGRFRQGYRVWQVVH